MELTARAPKRVVFQVWHYFKFSNIGKKYQLTQFFKGKGITNTVSENIFLFCKDSLQRTCMRNKFQSHQDIAQSIIFLFNFLIEIFKSFGYKEQLNNSIK